MANAACTKKSEFVCNGLDVKQKPEPNPVDIENIRNQFFKVTDEQLVIALVGRINSWKGQQLLLEAFHKIANKYPKTKLVYIGY